MINFTLIIYAYKNKDETKQKTITLTELLYNFANLFKYIWYDRPSNNKKNIHVFMKIDKFEIRYGYSYLFSIIYQYLKLF